MWEGICSVRSSVSEVIYVFIPSKHSSSPTPSRVLTVVS